MCSLSLFSTDFCGLIYTNSCIIFKFTNLLQYKPKKIYIILSVASVSSFLYLHSTHACSRISLISGLPMSFSNDEQHSANHCLSHDGWKCTAMVRLGEKLATFTTIWLHYTLSPFTIRAGTFCRFVPSNPLAVYLIISLLLKRRTIHPGTDGFGCLPASFV